MMSTKKFIKIFYCFLGGLIITFLSSCNAYKDIPYLKNADQASAYELFLTEGVHEPVIMPNDILSITVNSTIVGAATDFNLPVVPSSLSTPIQTTVTTSSNSGSLQNYIVDKNGSISFPVLGTLKISGMSTEEAEEYITSLIYPKYISVKPIVNIRFLNFQVSVLGEVSKPGIYKSDNGQMTVFDALAAAGDMTIYGKRDNVLLIRTKESGEIAMHRINLQDKSTILDRNTFYLQQNDKLYIEPNKTRGNNSRFGTLESIGLSALSVVISLIAIITR
ncbi:MAG: polysaccharide biosynthesis/export family protein [Dysgonomonas sp.]|nr:polysaccharide biosynthesis/export family protein [Dysgonomonas sp.]